MGVTPLQSYTVNTDSSVNYSSVNSDVSSKDKIVVDTSFTTSNQMISENINNSQKVEEFDFSNQSNTNTTLSGVTQGTMNVVGGAVAAGTNAVVGNASSGAATGLEAATTTVTSGATMISGTATNAAAQAFETTSSVVTEKINIGSSNNITNAASNMSNTLNGAMNAGNNAVSNGASGAVNAIGSGE